MIVDPKTGLVAVVDRAPDKAGVVNTIQMHPVDAKEAFLRGGVLKDNKPRYELAETYVVDEMPAA